MTNFRLLPGLPGYPPYARAFPLEWGTRGHEGTVVEFASGTGKWTGNFAPGTIEEYSTALQHPDGRRVLVVAGGDVWIVDPDAEAAEKLFSSVSEIWLVAKPEGYLLNLYGLAFARVGPRGILWHTRRLSWDGFRNIVILHASLSGEAWRPQDEWLPFTVDLSTGASTGGAYDEIPGSLTSDWEQLAPNDGAT